MEFEDSGRGFVGSGFYRWTRGKVVVQYPTCKRHGLWLSILQWAYPISIYGAILSWWIHYLLLLFFAAILSWDRIVRPVRIKGITKHFYTLEIRDRDYAREFALLNSFDAGVTSCSATVEAQYQEYVPEKSKGSEPD